MEQDGKPSATLITQEVEPPGGSVKQRLFALVDQIRRQNPSADADKVLLELEELDRSRSSQQ